MSRCEQVIGDALRAYADADGLRSHGQVFGR